MNRGLGLASPRHAWVRHSRPFVTLLALCLSTPAEDAYTDELIEQILENYTFKFEPEVRLKLKHRLVCRSSINELAGASSSSEHACQPTSTWKSLL